MNVRSFGTAPDASGYHDQLAGGWERRYKKLSFRARLAVLAECLGDEDLSGTEWLDAGCGTGTLSRWLAERGCTVLGVDAAPEMINAAVALANSRASYGKLRFELVETIARLPLAADSADGILCSSVLEYVSKPEACLREFARVLRRGGLLVVSVPSVHSVLRRAEIACHRLGQRLGRNWITYLNYSRTQYSTAEFERMLVAHGLVVDRVISVGGPLPRWIQRKRSCGPLLMFLAKKN